MAASIRSAGYLQAYERELAARGRQLKGHGPTDGANAAGIVADNEHRAIQASQTELPPMPAPKAKVDTGPSTGEGAAQGAAAGAATGNPYVMAGMAALGAINASKNRKAAEWQNRKTGRENALQTYISAINGMA